MYSATLTRRRAIERRKFLPRRPVGAPAARDDLPSIDGVEFPQPFVERESLGVAVDEDQHRSRPVGGQEFGDAAAPLPEFRFENLDARVQPMYRPLNDGDEEPVGSSVGHHGIRQLSVHRADPNSRSNCPNSELTGEPPMKSATACRSAGSTLDSVPFDSVVRHVPSIGRNTLIGPSPLVSARSTKRRSPWENWRATSGE